MYEYERGQSEPPIAIVEEPERERESAKRGKDVDEDRNQARSISLALLRFEFDSQPTMQRSQSHAAQRRLLFVGATTLIRSSELASEAELAAPAGAPAHERTSKATQATGEK